jgi:hypothetical protein
MKRFALALLALLVSGAAYAQPVASDTKDAYVTNYDGDPTTFGACSQGSFWLDGLTSHLWNCRQGVWVDISAAAGGVTFPLVGSTGCTNPAYSYSGATSYGTCWDPAGSFGPELRLKTQRAYLQIASAAFGNQGAFNLFTTNAAADTTATQNVDGNGTWSAAINGPSGGAQIAIDQNSGGMFYIDAGGGGADWFWRAASQRGPDGSASEPAYSFNGSTGMGMWRSGGTLGIGFLGAAAARSTYSASQAAMFYDNGLYNAVEVEPGQIDFHAGAAQRFQVINGGARLVDSGAKPTCSVTNRGVLNTVWGGAGVADTVEVCSKDGADAYAWRTLIP